MMKQRAEISREKSNKNTYYASYYWIGYCWVDLEQESSIVFVSCLHDYMTINITDEELEEKRNLSLWTQNESN